MNRDPSSVGLHGAAALLVALAFLVPIQAIPAPDVAPPSASEACDLFYRPGTGMVCDLPNGVSEIFGHDGTSFGYTHGPDHHGSDSHGSGSHGSGQGSGNQGSDGDCEDCPETANSEVRRDSISPGKRMVHCWDDKLSTPHHTKVIYARSFDDGLTFRLTDQDIRDLLLQANALIDQSGLNNGTHADMVVECSQGAIKVHREVLWTPWAATDFTTLVADLRRAGYDDGRVKYLVYYDDFEPPCYMWQQAGPPDSRPPPMEVCPVGEANVFVDDSPGQGNLNNGNAGPMFGVSWAAGWATMLHEWGHTVGAVQQSAPNWNGDDMHCIDDLDIMCENFRGGTVNITGDARRGACRTVDMEGAPGQIQGGNVRRQRALETLRWDCNNNDYFNVLSPQNLEAEDPEHYLIDHWNIARSRYVHVGGSPMEQLSCPNWAYVGQPVACTFSGGNPDSVATQFNVRWDDGAVTIGVVTTGMPWADEHTYEAEGHYRIRVYADPISSVATPPIGGLPWDITIYANPVDEAADCVGDAINGDGTYRCPAHIG